MADFCKDCTEDCFGPDLPNDFRHLEVLTMALCEGCGVHWFEAGGKRSHPMEDSIDERSALAQCPICLPEAKT